jgi:uncharacterized Ntn-hydrolase superfamily protein
VRNGTYSNVARDAATGELGVAVQSHWFSVGSIVSWAQAGVGAVATQSIAEPAYGPRALELLAAGANAREALDELLAADAQQHVRQVGVVDSGGRVAAHTGPGCIPFAGHETGEAFSCQANIMASPAVWPAMAEAFAQTSGDLADRLVAALAAAEREGGDLRGRQSAALLVVPAEGEPWMRRFDLRVEDHAEPLAELHRVLALARAYEHASAGDELVGEGRHAEAGERYERALELAPYNPELLFFGGLAAAQAGDLRTGTERVKAAIERGHAWVELLRRLSPEIAPAAEAVREALGIDSGDESDRPQEGTI